MKGAAYTATKPRTGKNFSQTAIRRTMKIPRPQDPSRVRHVGRQTKSRPTTVNTTRKEMARRVRSSEVAVPVNATSPTRSLIRLCCRQSEENKKKRREGGRKEGEKRSFRAAPRSHGSVNYTSASISISFLIHVHHSARKLIQRSSSLGLYIWSTQGRRFNKDNTGFGRPLSPLLFSAGSES